MAHGSINPFPSSYFYPNRVALAKGADEQWRLVLRSAEEYHEAVAWFRENDIVFAEDDEVIPSNVAFFYTYTVPYIRFADDEAAFLVKLRWV